MKKIKRSQTKLSNRSLLKPWARLGIKKEKYLKIAPWKKTTMSRAKYEKVLLSLLQGVIDDIRRESEAQAMIENIFGEELAEEIGGLEA